MTSAAANSASPSNGGKDAAVAMLIANFHPHLGGAEKQALELSKALLAQGAGVFVVTRRLPGLPAREDVEGVPVFRLPVLGSGAINAASFMLSAFFFLLKKRADYKAIHVHIASSHALAACAAGFLTRKKVLIKFAASRDFGDVHTSLATLPGRLKLKVLDWFRPTALIINTEIEQELRDAGLHLPVRRFRNGVDTGRYVPLSYSAKVELKKNMGFTGEPLFVFAGRLVRQKRLLEFLEAWAELKREMPGCKAQFALVGEGPLAGELQKAAAALEISRDIVFAGLQREMLPYYQAADIFTLPSSAEGLSNAMLEAMSCGLAVFASRIGGAKEAVAEGKSGLLFDPYSRTEIKNGLRRFFEDAALSRAMGGKARSAAVEHYCMNKVAKEALETYTELCAE